jgi:hypothetical protein
LEPPNPTRAAVDFKVNVVALEEPVRVLEAVLRDIRVVEKNRACAPVRDIRRADEGQGIANAARVVGPMPLRNQRRKRPVKPGLGVEADCVTLL